MTTRIKPSRQSAYKSLSFIAVFFFSISACQVVNSDTNPHFLTMVTVKNSKLTLHHQQGQCVIKTDNTSKTLTLNIPYPCGFVRASKALIPQTYIYKDIGQVFVVAGPLADEKDYLKDSNVNVKNQCSHTGAAIIVNNGALTLRPKQTVPLGFCHRLGFDEKDYYGLAYAAD